jgi:proteasome lid subunit RPN8/RPN11
MVKHVVIDRSVIDSILTFAKIQYPREGILLLRGTMNKDEIRINEVVLPPLAVRGHGFSAFPLHMLPMDLSLMGTAHSHPSGALRPSTGDLNSFYGRILVITAYPFESEEHLAVFDRVGRSVKYGVLSGR